MGRPEPCVLFSQTFVHPQLDEYVDEVVFTQPVVITACEFLEQNASSVSQAVQLVGATSPPSFALEVFVQCEGETRFRRLCQPFLYSHSSSNVLEVEAVVTSHVVLRGSYRSLSLVIYGNTAEDLGQVNIEFDDSSLTNIVSSAEGKLEDLPLALRSTNRIIEGSLTSLNVLSLYAATLDISVEVKQILHLILKMLELPDLEDSLHKVVSNVAKAVCYYVTCDLCDEAINKKHLKTDGSKDTKKFLHAINEARKELFELLQRGSGDEPAELLADSAFLESEVNLASSKQLVDEFGQYFCLNGNSVNGGHHQFPQNKNIILRLSVALLSCSGRESCFQFVNGGGMEQLAHLFCHDMQDSAATMLLLLGAIEQATRHPIGCEGILGWWPREDENIPSSISRGYSLLLRLLLQKPRHDVATLATYVLHRLRVYEVAARYESAVLSLLGGLSTSGKVTNVTLSILNSAKFQLKKLMQLINSRGPIEDPSPVACASRSLIMGQTEGSLSYRATSNLIASSNCCFSTWDVDSNLLALLKERGFIPLSAALLTSSKLRSEVGDAMDTFVDIVSTIGAILLSLLTCRSGLIFLLQNPELATTLIDALSGSVDVNKEECVPLRYASVLLAKGFVCSPKEVGMNVEMHLRVVSAIDRLLISTPHSEEFLCVLWELCGISRLECGRQALLVLGYFPEALSMLIEALRSVIGSEPVPKSSGASPINLAIIHSAAEIFEIIVTDSTASLLDSWIGHAMELHKALHSSSPGSNRKDAPTRLLEWIDAGVVYHKNGAIGLLRYAAVLASGGDAHLTSTSILVSDLTDAESLIGDASGDFDVNVMDNLGKIVCEKTFDGVSLRDSSVAQLTTAIRILAFISESPNVAATLYDEGAIIVVYAILVNCSFMLERSSNSYDYLVDEGTECNSTSDLLSERNREQSLVDLLVPSLVLLINLLQELQEAKEQHRNTKLMSALLRLHREVSPRLAACAADLSSSFPVSALGFEAVCHLIVSALSCWPVYGWTPGLFHSLLANVQVTSLLASGPKETCSLLCFLNDLFSEEGVYLWKNGMPLLSGLRTLAVGTLLGPQKERQVNWYLESPHLEKLLSQLTPHLNIIAQIIKHYAISALVVIQDMLRVFIVRVACQYAENASVLLGPLLSCIRHHVSDSSSPSEINAYKVYRYLEFIVGILEHPCAKTLLLEEGIAQLLIKVLGRSFNVVVTDGKQISDAEDMDKSGFNLISWCLPVFKSFSLLCDSRMTLPHPGRHDLQSSRNLTSKDCSFILFYVLKFCQVLPVGKELLACLTLFKELSSCNECQSECLTTLLHHNSIEELQSEKGHERNWNYNLDDLDWRKCPPFLSCWMKLLNSVKSNDDWLTCAIEAVNALSAGALCFCKDTKSLNVKAVDAIKFLFGISDDVALAAGSSENINYIEEMSEALSSKISDDDYLITSDIRMILSQATESAKSLLLLLQKPSGSVTLDQIVCSETVSLPPNHGLFSSKIKHLADAGVGKADGYLYLGGFGEKFLWECPETLPDRLSQSLPAKRKLSSVDGTAKRGKGENSTAEMAGQIAFSRGLGPPTASSGPTRRDTFRQRKPNTSRPPSMHVDDYVARERSGDGGTNSNVIAVPRIGSTGGRPPSIHVDEFMARQRERQNPTAAVVGEASVQVKNTAIADDADKENVSKPKQLKTDLDDDLHGIDIVFDGEESESDDKLPFLQPDDSLQQLAPVIVEKSSPRSIAAETESDANGSSQFPPSGTSLTSIVDENTQSEFSSRMSVSRPEVPLVRESSVSSDMKFFDQSDDSKNVLPAKTSTRFDSVAAASSSGFPASVYNNAPVDFRMTQQNFFAKNSPQHTSGSRVIYDQKVPLNQPPLPPVPPPSIISPVISKTPDPVPSQSSPFVNTPMEVQPPHPSAFQIQPDYISAFGNSPGSLVSSLPMPDSKYPRASMSSPSGSTGPHPPLPPMPPPFSSSPYNLPSLKASTSQSSVYGAGPTEHPPNSISSVAGPSSYVPHPMMPPLVFSRPLTLPAAPYGSNLTQQQGENPSMLQNFPIPQSMPQLQPLQPPLQRPQPPQHLWPPVQSSQQQEPGVPLQNPTQMQMHQVQMLQQPQISPMQTHYQAQQQEHHQSHHQQQAENTLLQAHHQQGEQQDLGMSLHEYFKDPKAITALLSNKEELCRLLEQHPKLMQMLQERLGQQ